MTNDMEALLTLARTASPEPADASPVVAIIRLADSRRSWFVTAVRQRNQGLEVVGYAPGCQHRSGGWFCLDPRFFEVAAAATGDRVLVEFLKTPVALDTLEDESL